MAGVFIVACDCGNTAGAMNWECVVPDFIASVGAVDRGCGALAAEKRNPTYLALVGVSCANGDLASVAETCRGLVASDRVG